MRSSKIYSFLTFIIGWPLTVLALLFIIKIITPQMPMLISHMQNMNLMLFIYGLISFLSFYYLRAFIWHRLLRAYTYKIPFKLTAYLWAISELKRYIPGNLWSFLGRTVLFSEKEVKKKDIASCLLIEAEIFIIGCIIVSILAIPFITHYGLVNISPDLKKIIIFAAILILLIYIFNKKIILFLPIRIKPLFNSLFPNFQPSVIVSLISVSIIALILFGLGNYFIILSVISLDPHLVVWLSGYFVLAFIIGYVSLITPAGFGVREGIVIAGLSKLVSFTLATFAALFSRIVLILSELLFILIIYIWQRSRNEIVKGIEDWIENHQYESILFILCIIYTIYFATTSFLRYDNFYTGRFDLGNMVQTVWNTSRGRIFVFTDPNGTDVISRLAFHADFLLILLAPLYTLWPDPKSLLLLQAAVVSLGAFFVYYIAKEFLRNKNLSLVFAFAYLINPSVQRANLYEFHAVTLATTFLLGTYYFYLKRKYKLFILFAILSALCKEEIWLITALFGIFLFIRQSKRLMGTAIFLISIGIFYYLIWHAIPDTLKSQHFALSYYSEFGDTPTKIIKTVLRSPNKIFDIIKQKDHIIYLTQLFSPIGYLSIFFPVFLIFAIPDLLIDLLSNNPQLHQIYYQYTATITPFIFIAAIHGSVFIKKCFFYISKNIKISKYKFNINLLENLLNNLLIIYLLLFSIYTAYLFGPLPGAKEANLDMIVKPLEDKNFINSYLSQIPKRYSVAASNNVGSHLSQRQRIYTLPLGVDKADIIVFLLTDPDVLPSMQEQKQLLQKLRQDPRYILVIDRNKFVVFKKKGV